MTLERPDGASCLLLKSGVFTRSDPSGILAKSATARQKARCLVPAGTLTEGSVSGFRCEPRNRKRIAEFSRSPRSDRLRRRSRRRSEPGGPASTNCDTSGRNLFGSLADGRLPGRGPPDAVCEASSARIRGPRFVGKREPPPGASGSRHGPPTSLPSHSVAAARRKFGNGGLSGRTQASEGLAKVERARSEPESYGSASWSRPPYSASAVRRVFYSCM